MRAFSYLPDLISSIWVDFSDRSPYGLWYGQTRGDFLPRYSSSQLSTWSSLRLVLSIRNMAPCSSGWARMLSHRVWNEMTSLVPMRVVKEDELDTYPPQRIILCKGSSRITCIEVTMYVVISKVWQARKLGYLEKEDSRRGVRWEKVTSVKMSLVRRKVQSTSTGHMLSVLRDTSPKFQARDLAQYVGSSLKSSRIRPRWMRRRVHG